ncbi:MAG: hypothetical protein M1580_02460 [Candidatus Parvarchaeota archaeon]|nr:hypothetical protein [Candidatus Parvarchaeota archaeon]
MAEKNAESKQKSKRVAASFTKKQIEIIKSLVGAGYGRSAPDVISKIVSSWLFDNNYIDKNEENEVKNNNGK